MKLFGVSRRLRVILAVQMTILLFAYSILVSLYSSATSRQQDSAIQLINQTVLANTRYIMQTVHIATLFPISQASTRQMDAMSRMLSDPSAILESPADFNALFEMRTSELFFQFPSLDSVYLFTSDGRVLGWKMTQLYYAPILDCADSSWYPRVLERNGSLEILGEEDIREIEGVPSGNALYAGRLVTDPRTLRPLCIVVVGVKLSDVMSDFQRQMLFDNQSFAVYSKEGRKMFGDAEFDAPPVSFTGRRMQSLVLPHNLNGQDFTCHIFYDYDTEVYSVVLTPSPILNRQRVREYRAVSVVGIAVLVLTFFIFALTINSITKPLGKLVAACRRIGQGDFSFRVSKQSSDELGDLTGAFNMMSEQVETLITEVYQRKITERDVTLQMLRSQINPHFLYNTLESMRMMAYSQDSHELAEMCRLLANILRYAVTRPTDLVQVKEELDHLQDYIALQKFRFGDQLQVLVHVDQDIRSCRVIKLLLQPLVENCINHGLQDAQQGTIHIWGYRKDSDIIFAVSDNGAGMEREELERVRSSIANPDAGREGRHIGLTNIQSRIRLYYGQSYGISIDSKMSEGTAVVIQIPEQESPLHSKEAAANE